MGWVWAGRLPTHSEHSLSFASAWVSGHAELVPAAAGSCQTRIWSSARPNAKHAQRRWHVEMAQLNSFVRALIRVALGTALNPGSYPEALEAYTRATEIDSRRLIHRQAASDQH